MQSFRSRPTEAPVDAPVAAPGGPGASVATTSLLLGGIYITETAVYVAVLIALSGPVVRWMAEPRIRRRLDRLMGTVFVAFGVQLAVKP